MKKYIALFVALLMITGMVNAQPALKKTATSGPVAKMNKPVTKSVSANTASVSSSSVTAIKKTNTGEAIKRKHYHQKSKSVKSGGSK